MDITNWKYQDYWSLSKYLPRPEQIRIINEIIEALEMGFKNIIVEAGTGTGKSAIATTIANYIGDSYILTMTKQLQNQYLDDFHHMLTEIKGRNNYLCNCDDIVPIGDDEEDLRMCDDCLVDEINEGKHDLSIKYEIVNRQSNFEIYPDIPDEFHEGIIAKLELKKCYDCPYLKALKKAMSSKAVITNYDYLWYAGAFAGLFKPRDLLILDESHNLEKKVMMLITEELNRKTIMRDYGYDIFWGIGQGKTLKECSSYEYWIKVVSVLSNYVNDELKEELQKVSDKKYSQITSNSKHDDEPIENKKIKRLQNKLKKYAKIIKYLENEGWIIELPTKKEIISDEYYSKGLKVTFKPLMVRDYSKTLLNVGNVRLFLTGTLGNHDKFCEWIGIDPKETYYLYVKSPFPVEHRPIIKNYVGSMSGRNGRNPNWRNAKAIQKIKEIMSKHTHDKGVIHTSSNQQAWFIKKMLNSKRVWVAQGPTREDTIKRFEHSKQPVTLVGAGLKDGVDFKGDKCRYQILFKIPYPSLAGKQVNIRMHYDPTWYAYQTIMPLMQSYGRGIRDIDDYCVMYVIDSDFDKLLKKYEYLFNEYFLEAIKGNNGPRPIPKPIKVNGA